MSISIYYTAKRSFPITDQEARQMDEIIARYRRHFPYPDRGEFFRLRTPDAPDCIFTGGTGLPLGESPEETLEACLYWAGCLTEIRRILPDADWHVRMEDYNLTWDEEQGWHFA